MNKTFVTFEQIIQEIRTRKDIISDLNKFKKIVAITRGGLVVAGLLSQYLDTRWYDTAAVVSYKDKKQDEMDIIKVNPTDEEVLLVDDIVDTGKTIKTLKKSFPNSKVFALHYKPEVSSIKPDYYFWETSDWIVYPWEID